MTLPDYDPDTCSRWYECQRLYNGSDWLCFKAFAYPHATGTSAPRMRARKLARDEAKASVDEGWQARVVHCELVTR